MEFSIGGLRKCHKFIGSGNTFRRWSEPLLWDACCFWSILIFPPVYSLIFLIFLFWFPIFFPWVSKSFECSEIVVSHILYSCFCCEIHQCTRIRYILHSSQVMLWGRNQAERLPCFYKHDIYFNKLMFIFKNINLELKLALRTKYWFLQTLLY